MYSAYHIPFVYCFLSLKHFITFITFLMLFVCYLDLMLHQHLMVIFVTTQRDGEADRLKTGLVRPYSFWKSSLVLLHAQCKALKMEPWFKKSHPKDLVRRGVKLTTSEFTVKCITTSTSAGITFIIKT